MNDRAFKPILCLDFDGVVHDYLKGWQDGIIYGNVTPGFFEWAEQVAPYFRLVIYSSRSATPQGIEKMQWWLYEQRKIWRANGGKNFSDEPIEFEFADSKPPAMITIDDRAMTFKGAWADFPIEVLKAFKPWNAGGVQ